MKYEKPEVEVMEFEFDGFMTSSLPGGVCNGYTDSVGHKCNSYTAGSNCGSWSTPSFGGGSCGSYDGHKCNGYTDSTHTNCRDYAITCSKF